MEIDRSSPEETAQASSEHESPIKTTTAAARSYECIFCKRGFSNAQALGGHMNIHRKDRAKLKKPTTNPKQFPFSPPSFMGYGTPGPWIMGRDQRRGEDGPRQLALFVESASHGAGDHHRASVSVGCPEVEELDLELRLGPETPGNGSIGLREFI